MVPFRPLSPAPSVSDPAAPRRDRLVALALFVVVAIIYGQTLGAGFINYDDPTYVYQNPPVRAGLTWAGFRWAWTSFYASNWHPLTWLSLMLDAQLYGLHAGGFHLTNVLLHALNSVLLYRWLRLATGAWRPAAAVAFLFAAHPLHVESVAWVTERKDVLSTLFLCLTLLAYTRFARDTGPGARRAYWLALGAYTLGLTAKPMLVTVPPLLLLVDAWPLRRFEVGQWRRLGPLLVEKIPFIALAAASCAVTFAAQFGRAVVALGDLPPGYRLATATLGVGTYLQQTFWPVGLSVFYPYWIGVSWGWPVGWGLALVALTAGAAWQWRRRPYLAVGWLWFLGTLVPVSGLVQVGNQAVADRYTYVPHIGLFVALCWAGRDLWRRWPRARRAMGAAAAGLAFACVGQAAWQAHFWHDGLTLFAHSEAVLGRPSGRLIQLQAVALAEAGRDAEAAAAFERAWRANPAANNHEAAEWLARAWLQGGRARDAVALLEPLAAAPAPSADTLEVLADALVREGRSADALTIGRRCAERFPHDAAVRFALAGLLRQAGDAPGACAEYEAGLREEPGDLPALAFLAWTYAHLDNADARARALTLAHRAAALTRGQDRPSLEALAAAEAAAGRWPQAVAAAQDAVALTERSVAPDPGAAALCRERLASYRQGSLP